MIVALDHVVIATHQLDLALGGYGTLLDRADHERAERDGVATAYIRTGNVAVELMAPVGESEAARRLRAVIADSGEGLKSLVFAVEDINAAHRRAARVGLAPEAISVREHWRSCRLSRLSTHGVRLFLIERAPPPPADASPVSLDHVVVRSGDFERAAALYGARLGLDLRLDREIAGSRLMFFRCGGTVIELGHDLSLAGAPDRLWGLSWRVPDLGAAHERLSGAGMAVSEVRQGLKPGSRVFTVRDQTCGVPTLMIETSPNRD